MPEPAMPPAKRTRVIINTDAKNEADDQFAIVHALLTPSFELHGLIPAHFGSTRSATSLQDSHDEVMLLLRLMGLEGEVTVADGAAAAIPDANTPAPSAGADLIIAQALKNDPRPLHVAFLGPLTDMASAILIAPEVVQRDVRVVWIGGGYWPVGNRDTTLRTTSPPPTSWRDRASRSGRSRCASTAIWACPTPSCTSGSRARARSAGTWSSGSLRERARGRPDRAPLARQFGGDRRDDVSGMRRVRVGARA